MIIDDTTGIGSLEVTDVPLPSFAKDISATYTYSGRVLVFFKKADDPKEKDYWNIGVVNDDGSDFKTIFSGVIKQHQKANGIRHMPFQDNKRVLLGDYVLECYPDIDSCERAELVPVKYPWLLELDPRTSHHWSEIIIAPDNEHISWTSLRSDVGAANGLGILKRKKDKYVIKKAQVISTLGSFKKDNAREGYLIPPVTRGGEVKQFVRGGTAISLAGAKKGPLTDSVVQDLKSDEITQVTNAPGYDETTIFSPDERLGIVMTTRGSTKTNPAIFGLVPRPSYTSQGLIMHLYMYAVAGVRAFREGNIGPVLIDIERSMKEEGYQGALLNDPAEKWVYVSPMSWHPGGKKAMWLEMVRGSDSAPGGRQTRIRIVKLHDYQPRETVPFQKTPDNVPYGIKGLPGGLRLWLAPNVNKRDSAGKIAGKHSGYIEYSQTGRGSKPSLIKPKSTQSKYVNYSEDGKTFYNGFEKLSNSRLGETVYEADLELTGEQPGEMKLRATFSKISFVLPPKLLFEKGEDGKPRSYGYATYNGITLNIDDLVE